jgi:hypothetical protein
VRRIAFVGLLLLMVIVAGCGGDTTVEKTTTPAPAIVMTPTPALPLEVTPAPVPVESPLPVVTPLPTRSPANIQILESTVEADFPRTITFKLRAQSAVNVNKITLSYTTDRITVAPVISDVRIDFTPSTTPDVQWVWDMRRGGPPGGAKVWYQWILEDATGARLRTERKSFTYEDPRFQAQRPLGWGDITIYWYYGDLRFAQTLMDAAQDALDKLAKDTGAKLEKPVKIYIYASPADLRSSLVFPQEWTGGMAFTEYGIVAIGISPDRRTMEWGKRAIAHELAHLVTYQMTFNAYGIRMPTWLNEGLSMYAEGDMDAEAEARLNNAIKENKLFSVKTLSSTFPADAEGALLSYAQSESLVRFLIEKYGRDRMQTYLNLFKQGIAAEEGLMQVYGFDYSGLDAAWRVYVKAKPQPVSLTLSGALAGIFYPRSLEMRAEAGYLGV